MNDARDSKAKINFINPVDGILTSSFGYRLNPITKEKEFHNGIDIGADEGSKIYAVDDCVVERVGESESFGNFIECKCENGYEIFYGHLQKVMVKPNTRVKRNQTIGLAGQTGFATGPHLHYSIKFKGELVDPLSYVNLPYTDEFKKEYADREKCRE